MQEHSMYEVLVLVLIQQELHKLEHRQMMLIPQKVHHQTEQTVMERIHLSTILVHQGMTRRLAPNNRSSNQSPYICTWHYQCSVYDLEI